MFIMGKLFYWNWKLTLQASKRTGTFEPAAKTEPATDAQILRDPAGGVQVFPPQWRSQQLVSELENGRKLFLVDIIPCPVPFCMNHGLTFQPCTDLFMEEVGP
jgi:hypothetical protein